MKQGLSIKTKNVNLISSWKYDCDQEHCGICRQTFQHGCPNCDSPNYCPIAFGTCKHVFHFHCISQWLQQSASNYTCPLDRNKFELEKCTDNSVELPRQSTLYKFN